MQLTQCCLHHRSLRSALAESLEAGLGHILVPDIRKGHIDDMALSAATPTGRTQSSLNGASASATPGEGTTKKGKKSLQLDRNASKSVGGLGRDPSSLSGPTAHGGGCRCIVM